MRIHVVESENARLRRLARHVAPGRHQHRSSAAGAAREREQQQPRFKMVFLNGNPFGIVEALRSLHPEATFVAAAVPSADGNPEGRLLASGAVFNDGPEARAELADATAAYGYLSPRMLARMLNKTKHKQGGVSFLHQSLAQPPTQTRFL